MGFALLHSALREISVLPGPEIVVGGMSNILPGRNEDKKASDRREGSALVEEGREVVYVNAYGDDPSTWNSEGLIEGEAMQFTWRDLNGTSLMQDSMIPAR